MYGEGLLWDVDQKGLLHLRPRSGVILLEPLYRDLAIAGYDFEQAVLVVLVANFSALFSMFG